MSKYSVGDLVEFDESKGIHPNWDWKGTAIIIKTMPSVDLYKVAVKTLTNGAGEDLYEKEFSTDEKYTLTEEEIIGLVEKKDD